MAYIYIKVNRYKICDMILENTLNQNQQNTGFLKLCDIEWTRVSNLRNTF